MMDIQAIEVDVPLERPNWEKYGGYESAHKSSHSLLWNIVKRQFIPTPLFEGNAMACRFYRWLDVELGEDDAYKALSNPDSVDWSDLYGEFMATPLILKITFAKPEYEDVVDGEDGSVWHHEITFRKHDDDYNDIPPNDSRTFTFEVIPTSFGKMSSKHPVEVKLHITKKQKDSLPKYAKIGIEETLKGDEHWIEYGVLSGNTDWTDTIRIPIGGDSYQTKIVTSVSVVIVGPEWATKEASKDDLTY